MPVLLRVLSACEAREERGFEKLGVGTMGIPDGDLKGGVALLKTRRTAPPADAVAAARDRIIESVALIERLRAYGLDQGPVPDLPAGSSDDLAAFMVEDEARRIVAKWFTAFYKTIGLLTEFRTMLVHDKRRPPAADTLAIGEAAVDVLDSLFSRLEKKAKD